MDRKGIRDFDINTLQGQSIFTKLGDDEQQLLKLNTIGGFQTEKKKASWHDSSDGKCPICGMDDTSEHRFLECPAFHKKSEKIMGIAVASYKMKGKNGPTYLSHDITNM